MVSLKLYIVNHSERSREKVETLRANLAVSLLGNYELKVLDIMEHPEAAQQDNVLATPTLIKLSPQPVRRIVGDLSDKALVLQGLGIESQAACLF